jgi:hypothetical protein
MKRLLDRCVLPWGMVFGCALCAGVVALAADVDFFTDNGFDNAVASIQYPSAEQFNGKTYIAYQGPHEDPYVCVYDHAKQVWQGPVKAGVSWLGLTPDPTDRKEIDNHGKPAISVDSKGFVHVVFGGHGGLSELGENHFGTPGSGRQIHAVTKNPEDISSWEVLDNIDPFGTYDQILKMGNGDLYLFYRHGSHRSDWVYQQSTDGGRTFAPPVSVIKHKPQHDDPNTHDAWYAWFCEGKGDTITVQYIYHPCLIENHNKQRVNVYYMKMNCRDGTWANAAGTALTLPVTKEAADRLTLVHNSGTTRVNHGVCRVDETGAPHMFFRHSDGLVRYTRWLGTAWQEPTAVSGPGTGSQDGDMLVESPKVVWVILKGNRAGGGTEVGWWKTTDGGLSWNRESTVIASATKGYSISALVRNPFVAGQSDSPLARGQFIVQEHDYASPAVYRKLLFWGGTGFMGRPEAEAQVVRRHIESEEKLQGKVPEGTPDQRRRARAAAHKGAD